MKTQSKKSFTYTLAGVGIGLLASVGVRFAAGFFYNLHADLSTVAAFGVAGILSGAYFGYILSHFDYEGLFKHVGDKK